VGKKKKKKKGIVGALIWRPHRCHHYTHPQHVSSIYKIKK
jgi:hypothetical protein